MADLTRAKLDLLNRAVEDERLSKMDFAVLYAVVSIYVNGAGYSFAAQDTIAERLHVHRDSVRASLARLVELGYLACKAHGGRFKGANHYSLCQELSTQLIGASYCTPQCANGAEVPIAHPSVHKPSYKEESPTESLSPASQVTEEVIVEGKPPAVESKKPSPAPLTTQAPPRPLEKDGSWKSLDGLRTLAKSEIDEILSDCLITETDLRRQLEAALDPPSPENPKHGWARKHEEGAIRVVTSVLRNNSEKARLRPVTPEQAEKLRRERPWKDMREGWAQDQQIIRAHPNACPSLTSDGEHRKRLSWHGLGRYHQPSDIRQAMIECPHRAEMIAREKQQEEDRERFRQYQERQRERQAARC
jgi:hypothetical protein